MIRKHGFSLIELMTVIGIIGIVIALLLPSLVKARESARTLACLATLRSLGQAFQMYAAEQNGYLPYPTTRLFPPPTDQRFLWFNAVDPYLQSNLKQQESRTGIAATRTYKSYKQCYVWDTFEGDIGVGDQSTKEAARTYKMNAHLRHPNPAGHAKMTDVRRSSDFVLMGDGLSLDSTGPIASQWESLQFSMEVNDIMEASPSLRHQKGANILFVDGHASTIKLKSLVRNLRPPQDFVGVKTWESEFLNAAGQQVDAQPNESIESQGLNRNPNMPLVWSDPPRLHRP